MQQLIYICSRKSPLCRVIDVNYKLLSVEENLLFNNVNNLIFKRYITTKNNSPKKINKVNVRTNLYKSSTVQQQIHTSNDLKGQQPSETIKHSTTITNNENIWSTRPSYDIHISSLRDNTSTTFISPFMKDDPFKTCTSQSDITPVQLAEAAVVSAFEQSTPNNIPLTSSSSTTTTETVFVPKIFSTNIYSDSFSIAVGFHSLIPLSLQNNKIKYETINHPKEDLFYIKDKSNTSDSNEILIQHKIEIRNHILHESLNYVHEKGWTMAAIHAGMKKCNQPKTAEGLFYNGYDLVEYFMRDSNAKMTAYMNELANKEHIEGIRLLIEGLKYRLNLVIPYADIWEQALSQKGLPPNTQRAWKSLLDLANQAWLGIDDISTDIKWYTKRISIATIYRSAEIYMLKDQSPNKIETMKFLERHLDDFETMSTTRNSVSQSLSDAAQVASGLFTVI
ncbi:unnamed protein product [Rotaria sordida]|uniref:Ubiquinone biosynthesis protein n=1 Tax=Rotaria sordida TaxID=392033 RepID=A0A814ELN7_9BILA|nr:unnamed protein product [Rotaria sordida]CAF1146251.1 unnamed protein product [Rotaria sordida]